MQLEIQYLTHFHGNSKTDHKVKERVAWDVVTVELEHVPGNAMELVLHDRDGYYAGFDGDKAYAYLGRYWVVAEAANSLRGSRPTERRNFHSDYTVEGPLRNFPVGAQRSFAWVAFQFRFFGRLPSPNIYVSEPYHFRLYKPGDEVVWDDTPSIRGRHKSYYETNLLVVEDRVFCRIDMPALAVGTRGRHGARDYTRIFTPYGGHGDPVTDFDQAYENIRKVGEIRNRDYGYGVSDKAFFNPIDEAHPDGLARTVQACFADLFDRYPWSSVSERRMPAAKRRIIEKLHSLWLSNLDDMNEAVLDEAAEVMLPIAKGTAISGILERWLDRPVVMGTDSGIQRA